MLLQLTGRLEQNENYANINLDGSNLFFSSNKMVQLTLLNVIFCRQAGHSHFPQPIKANYPVDPHRYPETITRKKTRRMKRDATSSGLDDPADGENESAAVKRNADILPMEVRYFGGFRNIISEFVIQNLKEESPKTLIENLLNKEESKISANHFQQLLVHPLKYELITGSRIGQKKVQITLPPLIRLLCSDKSFFGLLGLFEQVEHIEHRNVWYLENTSRDRSKIFVSTIELNVNLKFAFHLGKYKAGTAYTLSVQRLEATFSSSLTFDSFCRQNPQATLKFFQLILEGTVEILSLPTDSLLAKFVTADVIALEKAASLQSPDDSDDNFGLQIQLGVQIQDLLGINTNHINCLLKKMEIKIFPPDSLLSDQEKQRCQDIINHLPTMFLNQQSENSIVMSWQAKYQQYLSDLANSLQQTPSSRSPSPPPPPPPPPPTTTQSETTSSQDQSTAEIDESLPTASTTTAETTTTTTTATTTSTTTTTTTTIQTRPIASAVDSTSISPAPPAAVDAAPAAPAAPAAAPADPAAETTAAIPSTADEQVETINNPDRRPPVDYVVANTQRVHVCTNPNQFPENCTLIVREGEPYDYIDTKGTCSILGLLRKSREPNIISNKCVLRAGQHLNSLSIEIIDDSLNTFKNLENTAVWVKLDLLCTFLE